MKEQTAMQELIEQAKTGKEFSKDGFVTWEEVIEAATELLTKEREQHTKTYTAGFYAGCDQPMMDNMPVDYFTTTYKQPL